MTLLNCIISKEIILFVKILFMFHKITKIVRLNNLKGLDNIFLFYKTFN